MSIHTNIYRNKSNFLNILHLLVIICNYMSSLCMLGAHGNSNVQWNSNCPNIFYRVKDKTPTHSSNTFARIRFIGDARKTLIHHCDYCTRLYVHTNATDDHDLQYQENHDTLTQNDIVQTQYMRLPYPAVSHRKLEHEKKYYELGDQMPKIPYRITYGMTFEALNHFLYNGRNNFR